ncbi:bifunctional methylenetetrahydrofolate dehydrogenase/methenyltetrahydrofolate cyclohydrolase FolD [Candidatus Kryptobacter tengchongensis]|uniref:Bifunctional protein FolD n=1 Tax=Kryptobacter tengchongensis TaxID=1643429 RepID=A0A656D633_KRYT1|nr:bifunctional methylenetetrahydrofolate dehydrogenase/methenyltetrahydrofolate cyclohydrolase FolD [Candidatus Kryptobacter tengchongensis]CUT01025.1 methylenetetrahydrofolate dehydrogenase (NADP+) / methenyltetrahydrofolate cyclohydrolase [Candidatus Kryptobacter tengchongensis]
MPAQIINGKKISEEIKQEIKQQAEALFNETGVVPGLAFILVGDNPASQVYVKMKGKACEELGFYSITLKLPTETSENELIEKIQTLNSDPKIHGILVQLPLPPHIDEQKILQTIDPIKDVDGFHPVNVGKLVIGLDTYLPCTPAGIQELLKRSGINPSGKHVVIVGRSNIVGKPIANILIQKKEWANATVTVCHTGTKDIAYFTKQADILIAAMGNPEFIKGNMIKPGAIVIDVGVNRINDPNSEKGYKLVGDVHFESAYEVAGAITPVPGGVGPMTIAMLMKNTLKAALNQLKARHILN